MAASTSITCAIEEGLYVEKAIREHCHNLPRLENTTHKRTCVPWRPLPLTWCGLFGAWRKKQGPVNGQFLVRKLTDSPKRYPQLATFLNSDDSYTVYRRFSYLQTRLLLDKQEQLRMLEKRLDNMDEQDEERTPKKLITRDVKEEDAVSRNALLAEVENKFREYASLLIYAQKLASFNKPTSGEYQSIVNYMDSNAPVVETEAEWIRHTEDIITLRPGREHAWLDSTIEHVLKWMQCKLGAKYIIEYLFCSELTKGKSDGNAVYYCRARIERVAVSIIICSILALLVVPIYILYHLVADIGSNKSYTICIGILLLSTLAFSGVISLFTRAKRHEILGAAAAYCAVLVVFLGNVGPKHARPYQST